MDDGSLARVGMALSRSLTAVDDGLKLGPFLLAWHGMAWLGRAGLGWAARDGEFRS